MIAKSIKLLILLSTQIVAIAQSNILTINNEIKLIDFKEKAISGILPIEDSSFILINKFPPKLVHYDLNGKVLKKNLLNYNYFDIFNEFISNDDNLMDSVVRDFQFAFKILNKNNYNLTNTFYKDSILYTTLNLHYPFLEIDSLGDSTIAIGGYCFLILNNLKGEIINVYYLLYPEDYNYYTGSVIDVKNNHLLVSVRPKNFDVDSIKFIGKYLMVRPKVYQLSGFYNNTLNTKFLKLYQDFNISIIRVNDSIFYLPLLAEIHNINKNQVYNIIDSDTFYNKYMGNSRKEFSFNYRINSLYKNRNELLLQINEFNKNYLVSFENNKEKYRKSLPKYLTNNFTMFLNDKLYYADVDNSLLIEFDY